MLTWKIPVLPAESKVVAVKYIVTSPKDMSILLE